MKVTLNHEEVLEACQEWVERHYGFKASKGIAYGVMNTGNNQTHELRQVAVELYNCPKPEGGPYRTPGE